MAAVATVVTVAVPHHVGMSDVMNVERGATLQGIVIIEGLGMTAVEEEGGEFSKIPADWSKRRLNNSLSQLGSF